MSPGEPWVRWTASFEERTIPTEMLKTAGVIVLPPSPALPAGFAELCATMARERVEAAGPEGATIRGGLPDFSGWQGACIGAIVSGAMVSARRPPCRGRAVPIA